HRGTPRRTPTAFRRLSAVRSNLDGFGAVNTGCGEDLHWNTLDDVYFVQIHTKRYSDVRDCGIYARLQDDEAYFINVVVVVDDPHIGTQCMKDALKQAAVALSSASRSKLSPSLTRLG
ncbi:MAG: hypothetical protein AAF938_28920, partial [Myxococcota bacterium]